MKEVLFIRRNIEKWRQLEKVVETAQEQNPCRLADAYTEITTDLSFSRSRYPQSRITIYLNNLASALHNVLYKNRKEPKSRIITFWTREIPLAMYSARRELLYSFLIFLLFSIIGCVSTIYDDGFARHIMGDGYIEMTLDNIANGNPMGVYDSESPVSMFIQIAFNNIRVSFIIFIFGLMTGFGTGILLLYNGIMIGTFQTFCFMQNIGLESMLAIWLHGALEISAIIISGAAGFVLGNGWLFPGTYPRSYAFVRGARLGLKIIVGLVPVFLLAAFIESFLTRHTEAPDVLRGGFIVICLAFVLFYYVFLPKRLYDNGVSKS